MHWKNYSNSTGLCFDMTKAEMTGLFSSIQIRNVEKVFIENNEFSLKHQLLIEKTTQPFLLYQAKPKTILFYYQK